MSHGPDQILQRAGGLLPTVIYKTHARPEYDTSPWRSELQELVTFERYVQSFVCVTTAGDLKRGGNLPSQRGVGNRLIYVRGARPAPLPPALQPDNIDINLFGGVRADGGAASSFQHRRQITAVN
ncbi:hypothetical protein EVAR_21238_1 [Eumeta japonica]|uniref:Uncharacterized protein n=1 Tax=Eumeta variegata TaxID=151549 RepID=A0A4C1YZV3_EUMVA|nr:hypothetical protein EVAR_21238_1 [Eumeta japonica]